MKGASCPGNAEPAALLARDHPGAEHPAEARLSNPIDSRHKMNQKMMQNQEYVGIHDDKFGGMTHLGLIVKDAWVFGLVPDTETCAGWSPDRMQILYDRVSAAWEPYGFLPSRLPPDLRKRHTKIHEEAVSNARGRGWDPILGEDD